MLIHCVQCPFYGKYLCEIRGERRENIKLCPHADMRRLIEGTEGARKRRREEMRKELLRGKDEAAPEGAALPYGEKRE